MKYFGKIKFSEASSLGEKRLWFARQARKAVAENSHNVSGQKQMNVPV